MFVLKRLAGFLRSKLAYGPSSVSTADERQQVTGSLSFPTTNEFIAKPSKDMHRGMAKEASSEVQTCAWHDDDIHVEIDGDVFEIVIALVGRLVTVPTFLDLIPGYHITDKTTIFVSESPRAIVKSPVATV